MINYFLHDSQTNSWFRPVLRCHNYLIGLPLLVVAILLSAGAVAQEKSDTNNEATASDQPKSVSIYVWNKGDDSQAGTKKAPKKTLAAALELARGNGVPTTIWIAGGIYPVKSAIKFSKADTRTEDAPLTIRNFTDKTVVLSAGTSIPNGDWQALKKSDRLAGVIPGDVQRQIVTVDLSQSQLKKDFSYRPDPAKRERHALISWGGYVLQQAKWPNNGYADIDKVLNKGPSTRHLKKTEKPAAYSFENPTGGSFTIKNPPDLARLQQEFELTGDMQVRGYLHNDWFFQTEPIGRIDLSQQAIQLVRYTRYGLNNTKIKLARRFRIVNAVSQIDQPGEWYYDSQDQRLYLWPVKKFKTKPPAVSVIGKNSIFEGKDLEHIRIVGLIFENFGKSAIRFGNCHHVLVAGCEFRAGIGMGVRLQGTHNAIQSCDFHGIDGAAVLSGIESNRRELIAEHNRAVNNHVWNCRARGYGAFTVRGVGAYFAHNVMHHMNSGVRYGSNDFVAEYNEFYDMGNEMGDWNVAYNGADLSLQNNVFRYNFFHHFMETPGAHPIAAVRADDGASGLKFHSNIVMKTGRAGVQFSGPNSEVVGNFLLGVPILLWTVQRPYDDQVSHAQFMDIKRKERNRIEKDVANGVLNFNDKENIVAKAEGVFGKQGWKTNKAWTKKYPNFAKHFDFNDFDHSPWNQSYVIVKDNYVDETANDFPFHFHGKNPSGTPEDAKKFLPKTAKFWVPQKRKPTSIFVRPDRMDFVFKRSPKLKGDAKAFNFNKVGLVVDEYRKTTPDKKAYRIATQRKYEGISSDGGRQDPSKINLRFQPPEYLKLAD